MDKLGLGYKLISERIEVIENMRFDVKRIRCTCCNGILDYYYTLDSPILSLVKIEIIKKGKK